MHWRDDWNSYDGVVAHSIFGLSTPDAVEALVAAWLPLHAGRSGRILTLTNSVGCAMGVELADGSNIFVKAWPAHKNPDYLAAQARLQHALASQGYPAPRVCSPILPFGPAHAVVMEHLTPGEPTDVRRPGVAAAMATGLANLVSLAAPFTEPSFPRPEEPEPGKVWPRPHTAGFDFEATADGAQWLDAIAAEALTVMRAASGPPVLSHFDWSAKNMRMDGETIAAVYDWDSVFLAPETLALGPAIAHFPMSWDVPCNPLPTPDEMAAFLARYEQTRGRAFTAAERTEIAAAATYARAYVARCEHGSDDPPPWEGSQRQWLADHGPYRFEGQR